MKMKIMRGFFLLIIVDEKVKVDFFQLISVKQFLMNSGREAAGRGYQMLLSEMKMKSEFQSTAMKVEALNVK